MSSPVIHAGDHDAHWSEPYPGQTEPYFVDELADHVETDHVETDHVETDHVETTAYAYSDDAATDHHAAVDQYWIAPPVAAAAYSGDADFSDDEPARGVNWPTVALAAGIAAVVSSLLLTLGMVGVALRTSDRAAAPAAGLVTLAVPAQPTTADPRPTTPTLGDFQRDLEFVLGDASAAKTTPLLEGGAAAATVASKVAASEQVSSPSFRSTMLGPVRQDGTSATARLTVSSPGFDESSFTVRYVWADGRWKLSNQSLCQLAAFARVSCALR